MDEQFPDMFRAMSVSAVSAVSAVSNDEFNKTEFFST